MKKFLFAIVFIFFLSGCEGNNLNTDILTNATTETTSEVFTVISTEEDLTTEETTSNTTTIPPTTTEVPTTIPTTHIPTTEIQTTQMNHELVFEKRLTLDNRLSFYEFSQSKIGVFTLDSNPGVLYVDIEAFISLLDEGIVDFQSSYDAGVLTLSYSFDDVNQMSIKLDSIQETIEYTNFNIFSSLNEPYEFSYENGFNSESVDYIEGDLSGTIDLKMYDMAIEEKDNHIYLPLYLANLFFTGQMFEVYHIEDTLYVVDQLGTFQEAFEPQSIENEEDEENMVYQTINYLALLFDYFYGLREYYGVDSYLIEFEDLGFYNQTTFEGFNALFQRYIYSLGDLHNNILAFGYDADQTENVIPAYNDRIYQYYQVSMVENCAMREEISLIEYDDYYKLSINAFTLNTKDLMADLMIDIDPNKDIYIDLACNGGGYIYSIFEVLAYLSNDPIEMNYMNLQTGEYYQELYTPKEDVSLDNQFYVYINKSTYSAANLFVELVKENELAFVFGHQTFGGSASVSKTILPNNLWLTYSSNTVLLNQDLENIERGVEPNYFLDQYKFDGFDVGYDEISVLFKSLNQVNIDSFSLLDKVDLNVRTEQSNHLIEFDKYIVEYRDIETHELLYSKEISTEDFILNEQIIIESDLVILRIKAYFSYQGFDLVQTIYKQVVDDYSDTFNIDTGLVEVGITTTLNKHGSEDVDYIKINVEDSGIYQVRLNGESLDLNHLIFNLEGLEIESGNQVLLEPGTYLIKLDIIAIDEGDYTVHIEYVEDHTTSDS